MKAKIKEILRNLINCASVDGITEEGLERSVDDIIALFLFEVDSRTDLGEDLSEDLSEDGLLTKEQMLTKEEAGLIQDYIDGGYMNYANDYDNSSLEIKLLNGKKKTFEEWLKHSGQEVLWDKCERILVDK